MSRIEPAQRQAEADALQAEYVRKIVDEAPPFTPQQADLLRAVLRPAVKKWRVNQEAGGEG